MKAARFEARGAIVLRDRNLLALPGVILEGMPRIGMTASLSGSEPSAFSEPVHGVEFLDDEPGDPGPALTFEYTDEEELESWMDVGWDGRVLKLEA